MQLVEMSVLLNLYVMFLFIFIYIFVNNILELWNCNLVQLKYINFKCDK